jgi:hypothetical protein
MTPEDVINEISRKAAAMVSSGTTPRVVRVGRLQAEALRQGGHPGDTLTVAAPTARKVFTNPGEGNPASLLSHVSLLVEQTADESHLEVL